jgi:hypothetical protein
MVILSSTVFGASTEELLGDLKNARDKWAHNGSQHYQFTISDGCFCLHPAYVGPLQVTVRQNKILHLVYVGRPYGGYAYGHVVLIKTHLRTTVPELFDEIEKQVAHLPAANFSIQYDSTDGHPTRYEYDDPKIYDGQTSIELSAFKHL